MTADATATLQRRPLGRRRSMLLLLACCVAVQVQADVSQPKPQGFGIGDYEYFYDELPREHLRRFGRSAEGAEGAGNIQHVPSNAPRAPEAAAASVVQRVPRRPLPEEDGAAAAAKAPAPQHRQPAAPGAGVHLEPVPVPGAAADSHGAEAPAGQTTEPATELEPPPSVEGSAQDVPPKQAPQVPAAVPDARLAKEDMETSNFFWGLGPVYPHLYVYHRVPHLVPLHGWNPYHAYVISHPSK